jgi:N-acetylmuramoyl-L-alanine amidase
MRWNKPGLGLTIIIALGCAMEISGAAPEQQLTVYTAQTSYSLPVLDRDGKPYVSVTDLLSLLGASRPIAKGKEWRLEQPQNPEASATPPPAQPSPPSAEGPKRTPEFLVMIDPSHGGNDKGASFGGKLVEKDITLRLARELRKELEERGIAVRLLRESDIDLSLDRRAEITNEQHAGIYVALHAGRPGRGVRVYAPLLADTQQPLAGRFLPWESAQSGALSLSQTAARAVADELRKKGLTVANLGMPVRPLNNIATPAIAVELAPEEDDPQSLESQKRQNNVATAIALGIAQIRSQMEGRP